MDEKEWWAGRDLNRFKEIPLVSEITVPLHNHWLGETAQQSTTELHF